jgi:hypothetical protein
MIKQNDGGYILERTDHEKQLRQYVDRLTYALDELQIAMNILRTHYGVEFCDVSVSGRSEHKVHLACGIEELAAVLKREVKLDTEWRAQKSFRYDWTKFVQLAEKNSMKFLPLNCKGEAMYKMDGGASNEG